MGILECFKKFAVNYIKKESVQLGVLPIEVVLDCMGSSESAKVCVVYDNKLIFSKVYRMDKIIAFDGIVGIIEYYENKGVEVDRFSVRLGDNYDLLRVFLNNSEVFLKSDIDSKVGTYVVNKETKRLELHFDKDTYTSLSDSDKSDIKSNFLFSRKHGCWVSRAYYPNIWRAESVAKKLGLEAGGSVGESLSFEEQLGKKSEKAERRAERYETYAKNAIKRSERLQEPLSSMRGDIAFFTQPNINSSSGRSFKRYREKLFKAYERGFEEFKKSEYYKDKALTALATANSTKPDNKAFCLRRMEEARKVIKAQKKNLEEYKKRLELLQSGKEIKRYDGTLVTIADIESYIDKSYFAIEEAISKEMYYSECLEELGGIGFSKGSIKKGYIVKHERWGRVRVVGVGPKNFKYVIMDGGASGMGGSCPYAEIVEIVDKAEENVITHPFEVGEVYKAKVWDTNVGNVIVKEFKIIKTTDKSVTIQSGDEKPIVRKPRAVQQRGGSSVIWEVWVGDNYSSMFSKVVE